MKTRTTPDSPVKRLAATFLLKCANLFVAQLWKVPMEVLAMVGRVGLARNTVAFALLLGSFGFAAIAQETGGTTADPSRFVETFDSGDPEAMLGGQLDLMASEANDWDQYVTDGKFVVENRTIAQSVYYNDVSWVKFPDSGALEPTESAVISAIVEARNKGSGGVGIYFGSGEAGSYLAFLVDAEGQYHVLRKQNGKVKRLHSGQSDAILSGKPNEIALAWRGASLVFFANDVEIISVPHSYTPGRGDGGLGLAAFGIGTYLYDRVEFSRVN
jgi:hypothetical protein